MYMHLYVHMLSASSATLVASFQTGSGQRGRRRSAAISLINFQHVGNMWQPIATRGKL